MAETPLWAPWRIDYILQEKRHSGCILCDLAARPSDEEGLVLGHGDGAYVVLNRYPYAPGHLMVVPADHHGELVTLPLPVADACTRLLQLAVGVVSDVLATDGINVGLNLGTAAGAGIPGHLHWHVVPRWKGDNNFMPVIGDQRVISEQLSGTWRRLVQPFATALEAAGMASGTNGENCP